jgi:cytochrome P450
VLGDPETFSNAASNHLSVPNGMDPPEHAEYRRLIEAYFRPEMLEAFEPKCRKIAAHLAHSLLQREEVELIAEFAQAFAVRVQCAFLGWPSKMHETLRQWTQKNQTATRAQDRATLAAIAHEFTAHIDDLLRIRREAGVRAPDDVTGDLLRAQVGGRPLRDDEIASVLRNWTVGEVGTITASVGILVQFLTERVDLQQQLREQPAQLPAAIEEILRIYGPLVLNRRRTTRAVEIGGRKIDAGERLSLIWLSANRDKRVFENPEEFQLHRNQAPNLLYGSGIHACPAAPLARLEMRVAMEELLRRTKLIEPSPQSPPTKALYPACGFARLSLRITV